MRPRPWMLAVLALGCTRGARPVALTEAPEDTLRRARERSVPDPVQTRLQLKIASPTLELAGSTGGGLVIDRPGRGRLDVFGPVGGRLVGATIDGEAMAVTLVQDKRVLVASDAETVLRELTEGAAGVDDLLAVLVGDLPLDGAEVVSQSRDEAGVHVELQGPASTRFTALLEPTRAVPLSIEGRGASGELLLDVTYDEWERIQGRWLPASVRLQAPSMELSLDLRYRQWVVPTEDPEVFDIDAPEGFTRESLEDVVRRAVGGR